MGDGCVLRDFRQAIDAIIDCTVEENGASRRMLEDEVNLVEHLHMSIRKAAAKKDKYHALLMERGKSVHDRISDILAQCDGCVHDWETGTNSSKSVQQLIALLNNPTIRCAMMAADKIANGRFSPELPTVPYEVDDDDGIAVKIVRLVKRGDPVGATIKKDSRGRVVVARVMAGSVAERSACISPGDTILEVNETPVSAMEPAQISALLNHAECGSLTLKLIPADPRPLPLSATNIHLRALCVTSLQTDYNAVKDRSHPCPESAISYERGDILELVMVGDEYWWQARRVGHGSLAGHQDAPLLNGKGASPRSSIHSAGHSGSSGAAGVGLIPSEALMLKRRHGGTLRRDRDGLGTMKSKSSKSSKSSGELDDIAIYESVCRLPPGEGGRRPILLVGGPGVGRNELKRRLIAAHPKRANETQGVEYHFVSRDTMEDMISRGDMMEFGEFKRNLYGTALSELTRAATKKTRDPSYRSGSSGPASCCQSFPSPPFLSSYYYNPISLNHYTSSRGSRVLSETDVDSILEGSAAVERQHAHFFDAEITNADVDNAVKSLCRLIDVLETSPTWVPLSWATREEDDEWNT